MRGKALALAALVAGAAGCPRPARAAAPARADAGGSWDAYRIKARQDLDVIGDRLAALESNAKDETAQAREERRARIAEMRGKKAEAESLLGKIKTSSEDERRDLKANLDRALSGLKESLDKAEAQLRDSGSSRPPPRIRIGTLA